MLPRWLRWWNWGQRQVSLKHWRVIMYTRKGCHLCDTAWERLRKGQRRYGFELSQTDVDTDAELTARFGTQVPVVEINGKVRFRGHVNEVLFQRLIDAEVQRR